MTWKVRAFKGGLDENSLGILDVQINQWFEALEGDAEIEEMIFSPTLIPKSDETRDVLLLIISCRLRRKL